MEKVEYAVRRLRCEVTRAKETLEKFQARLAENPHYAFEWSEDAFKAAAVLDVSTRVLHLLEKDASEGALDTVRTFAREAALSGARLPKMSTSVPSNLLETFTTAAWADLYSTLERY